MYLRSTLESKHEKIFNCGACVSQFGGEARNLARRKHKGCFDTVTRVHKLDNLIYYSCIGNYTHSSVDYLIELYLNFQRGVMPFAGGIQEQPNKIIEIFQIIEQVNAEKQTAIIEAERKKSNGR